MRNILIILCLIILTTSTFAQSGQEGFNYQAVLRDNSDQPIKNQTIKVTFNILNAPNGSSLYSESQQTTTDALGLFNLVIGENNPAFSSLNWGGGDKYIDVVVSINGNVIPIGTTRLQSVPFAKYALSAPSGAPSGNAGGDLTGTYPDPTVKAIQNKVVSSTNPVNGQVLKWDGNTNQWKPDQDNGQVYTAGPGIQLNGSQINNTGDLDALDDLTKSSSAGGDITGIFSELKIDTNTIRTEEIKNGSILAEDMAPGVLSNNLWELNGDNINNTNTGIVKISNTVEINGTPPNIILNNSGYKTESGITFKFPNVQLEKDKKWEILSSSNPDTLLLGSSENLLFKHSEKRVIPDPFGGGQKLKLYENWPLILKANGAEINGQTGFNTEYPRGSVEISKIDKTANLILSADSSGYSNLQFVSALGEQKYGSDYGYEFRNRKLEYLGYGYKNRRGFELNYLGDPTDYIVNIFKVSQGIGGHSMNFNTKITMFKDSVNRYYPNKALMEIYKSKYLEYPNLMLSSDAENDCSLEFDGSYYDSKNNFNYEFVSKPSIYLGDGAFSNKFLFQKTFRTNPIYEYNESGPQENFIIYPHLISENGISTNEIKISNSSLPQDEVKTRMTHEKFIMKQTIWGQTDSVYFTMNHFNYGTNSRASFEFHNPIEIYGSFKKYVHYAYFAKDPNTYEPITGFTGDKIDISLYAFGRIVASEFNAFSDKRIKNVLGKSNLEKDLETLKHLNVTDYTHIDVAAKGKDSKKGFIAQEVEEVFPEAVSKGTDFIPNIYDIAASTEYNPLEKSLKITLSKSTDLKKGDLIKLIADKAYEKEIVSIEENTFTVSDWAHGNTKDIFVYGIQVNDFRTVDYDRIFTLNVSATQELIRQVEQLKDQNNNLQKENIILKTKYDSMESKIVQIMDHLNLSDDKIMAKDK
jgi:hypothetical protein